MLIKVHWLFRRLLFNYNNCYYRLFSFCIHFDSVINNIQINKERTIILVIITRNANKIGCHELKDC